MTNILDKTIVLVLNRNWQAINVRTPQEAFCMMATNVATGLEIEGEDHIAQVLTEFVPLSKLMAEQITGLRNWAKGRARTATSAVVERGLRKMMV